MSKVRLSLDVSPELNDLLESLAVRIGGTKSDVLRKGIALLEVAIDAKARGLKMGVARAGTDLLTEIVGI